MRDMGVLSFSSAVLPGDKSPILGMAAGNVVLGMGWVLLGLDVIRFER